jgi:SAM-dependent methyltransferase
MDGSMRINDKVGILHRIFEFDRVELELGCGNNKRNKQSIGIDMLDGPDVGIVGDIYDVLAMFPSQSVDAVSSYHFVEHVPDVPKLLSELARVLKADGCVEFVAPHFSNPYFYSDPTHLSFFGLYSFCYYASESTLKRQVPTYGHKPEFRIEKVDLIFKSSYPFFIRYGIKRLCGMLFNSCNYFKELYEENFCYFFPCYEVRYLLRRNLIDS